MPLWVVRRLEVPTVPPIFSEAPVVVYVFDKELREEKLEVISATFNAGVLDAGSVFGELTTLGYEPNDWDVP